MGKWRIESDFFSQHEVLSILSEDKHQTSRLVKLKSNGKKFVLQSLNNLGNDSDERIDELIEISKDCKYIQTFFDRFIVDIKSEGKRKCVLLEYIEGQTLFEFGESDDSIDDSIFYRMMESVLIALSFLKDNGITHRNITPQNIIIDNHYNLYLTNFVLQSGKDFVGIDEYLSPDYLRAIKRGTPASAERSMYFSNDVWAAGFCLHEMLTGEPRVQPDVLKSIKHGSKQKQRFLYFDEMLKFRCWHNAYDGHAGLQSILSDMLATNYKSRPISGRLLKKLYNLKASHKKLFVAPKPMSNKRKRTASSATSSPTTRATSSPTRSAAVVRKASKTSPRAAKRARVSPTRAAAASSRLRNGKHTKQTQSKEERSEDDDDDDDDNDNDDDDNDNDDDDSSNNDSNDVDNDDDIEDKITSQSSSSVDYLDINVPQRARFAAALAQLHGQRCADAARSLLQANKQTYAQETSASTRKAYICACGRELGGSAALLSHGKACDKYKDASKRSNTPRVSFVPVDDGFAQDPLSNGPPKNLPNEITLTINEFVVAPKTTNATSTTSTKKSKKKSTSTKDNKSNLLTTSTPLFANADAVLACVTSIPRYYAPPRAVTASTKTPSIQTSQTPAPFEMPRPNLKRRRIGRPPKTPAATFWCVCGGDFFTSRAKGNHALQCMRFKAAKAAGKLDEQLALGKVTCLCGRMFASQTRKATHTTKCAEFQRWSRNRKTPGRLRS